jgi:hypothetical protein
MTRFSPVPAFVPATDLRPRFPDVNAAVGFDRTSAGSAKYRSSWIESIAHLMAALCS